MRDSLWPKRSHWTGRSWDRKGLSCAPPETPCHARAQPRGMEGGRRRETRTTTERPDRIQDTRGQGTGGREPRGQGGGREAASQVPEAPSPSGPHSPHTSAKRGALKFQDGSSGALNQAQGPVAHTALRGAGPDVWETEGSHRRQQAVSERLLKADSEQGHLPAAQAAGPTRLAGVCRLGRLSVSKVSISPTVCRVLTVTKKCQDPVSGAGTAPALVSGGQLVNTKQMLMNICWTKVQHQTCWHDPDPVQRQREKCPHPKAGLGSAGGLTGEGLAPTPGAPGQDITGRRGCGL